MHRKILSSLLLIGLMPNIALAHINSITEPLNLSHYKIELIRYHDSGRYDRDMASVVQRALYYLKFRITQNNRLQHPRKLAIVLDIDETALSNYDDMLKHDFGRSPKDVEMYISEGHDSAISYTRALFNYAKHNKIAVFFVTGRYEHLRATTVKNLTDVGYSGWQALYMKPEDYQQNSIISHKTHCRQLIEKQGYEIVLNLGDQMSDLAGGHADMAFKMPDPFYYIT